MIGCGEGGYKYFPSGYVLLERNLTSWLVVVIYQVRLSGYVLQVLSGYVLLDCILAVVIYQVHLSGYNVLLVVTDRILKGVAN